MLVYGGLRGALGLCLSLLVGVDSELPLRFRHLTVFYMASMAALTNLVNGTTCKSLVNVGQFDSNIVFSSKYLNMVEIPAVRKKVYKTYLRELVVSSEERQAELSND